MSYFSMVLLVFVLTLLGSAASIRSSVAISIRYDGARMTSSE
ncbi:hypothetical protein RIEGSTA812A_PEG_1245 [invertebrate metagenome]|uniref:Uncharacterized protein n=1 Tax=invertebrate metagenome TaxID=1711999 RepID=A0A484HD63_9ZZZZ